MGGKPSEFVSFLKSDEERGRKLIFDPGITAE